MKKAQEKLDQMKCSAGTASIKCDSQLDTVMGRPAGTNKGSCCFATTANADRTLTEEETSAMKMMGMEVGVTSYVCGPAAPTVEMAAASGGAVSVKVDGGVTTVTQNKGQGMSVTSVCGGSRALLYAATTASFALFTASF